MSYSDDDWNFMFLTELGVTVYLSPSKTNMFAPDCCFKNQNNIGIGIWDQSFVDGIQSNFSTKWAILPLKLYKG